MPPRTRTPAPTEPESPAPVPTDTGGYFRNAGQVELTVLGDGATAVLAPGRIAAFARTPAHRDLKSATEADYRTQQAADASADITTPSTDETQE